MDKPDYDALRFWLDAIQWLFIVALAVWGWIDRGRKDNKGAIKELTQQTDALERRLITAEEHMKHSPTHEDIAKLQSQYSALDSKLDRVTSTVDRIHDYLMNNKG